MKISQRQYPSQDLLNDSSLHPVLQRIYASRGIQALTELDYSLQSLLSPAQLKGLTQASQVLADAIQQQKKIMIIGDYDADGATSTALGVRALTAFGANKVSFIVPNRFEYGYGLTPEIVELAAQQNPDVLMTVDNGIASIAGVEAANAKGMQVVVTDHHLAGDTLPAAAAMVNPNQPGCEFPSKALAGVGVCFYVMSALRKTLQARDWFTEQKRDVPNLADFLDIVALGTVADVVPLDHNNRILIHQGLRRIRAGRCVPGITALLEIANRDPKNLRASDLGFAVGPRLNAAGRLDDMSYGIQCLLSDDMATARKYAAQLNQFNLERREIEAEMKLQALDNLKKLKLNETTMPYGLCLFDDSWHQGVIGILASRIKDQYHRPVIAFADAGNGDIKGSARSIKNVHIRDALDNVAKQHPTLITKFGGHAMAAGLSLARENFEAFSQAFDAEVRRLVGEATLQGEILTDGELDVTDFNLTFAELLENAGPWGQAFPEPVFAGRFEVIEQRIVGQNHLKLSLMPEQGDKVISAIYFNVDLEQWPNHRCQHIYGAYQLDINEFNGRRTVQLIMRYIEPAKE